MRRDLRPRPTDARLPGAMSRSIVEDQEAAKGAPTLPAMYLEAIQIRRPRLQLGFPPVSKPTRRGKGSQARSSRTSGKESNRIHGKCARENCRLHQRD